MGSNLRPRDSALNSVDAYDPTVWLDKGRGGLSDRQWNAAIGIVTAIVGNILISFALNIQRYAHNRLRKDRLKRQKSWASGRSKKATKNSGYGTQDAIAEERAEVNREAPPLNGDDTEHRVRYHDSLNDSFSSSLNGERDRSVSPASTVKPVEKGVDEEFKTETYLKSGYWWAGITLMTIGEAGNFLAYGFAPASIVSPLGVVALISNCMIAPWILKERFRQRDFWGVAVAVAGAVVVVLSAENNEAKLGPHKIWQLITRWEFELYLGLTAAAIIVLMWASGKYGDKSILIDLGLVGLYGGYTVLTTKGVASLLSDTLWRVITFPVTYLLVFVLAFTGLMQIRYVNRALQRFDSTQVIPTQFVMFTLSVIIGSAVLYRDFESTSAERMGKFVGGCALTFVGVYLITSGRTKETEEDEDDISEEGIRLVDEEAQEYTDEPAQDLDATPRQAATEEEVDTFDGESAPSRRQSYASGSLPRTPRRLGSSRSDNSEPFTPRSIDSDIAENPWLSSQEHVGAQPQNQTPQLRSQISTSSARPGPSRPTTPRIRPESTPGPSTSKDERRPSLAKKSISQLFNGPFVSPLSSSLRVIGQDDIRKASGTPSKPERRRSKGLSRLRSMQQTDQTAAESDSLLPRAADEGVKKKRSLSVSDTVGKLFRKVSSKSRSELRGDEESQIEGQQRGESSQS